VATDAVSKLQTASAVGKRLSVRDTKNRSERTAGTQAIITESADRPSDYSGALVRLLVKRAVLAVGEQVAEIAP